MSEEMIDVIGLLMWIDRNYGLGFTEPAIVDAGHGPMHGTHTRDATEDDCREVLELYIEERDRDIHDRE